MLSRFNDHALTMFEKHGITQFGFWTVVVGDGTHKLFYRINWASMSERELRWSAFQADPKWLEIRRLTESAEPIIRFRLQHVLAADEVLGPALGPVNTTAAHRR